MVEIEAAWPWARLEDRRHDQIGQGRQRKDDEQVSSDVADRAGKMRIRGGVNDLQRMQARVADLHQQNNEGHESHEDPPGRATATDWSGNLETSIRHEARRHRASQWRSSSYNGGGVFVALVIRMITRDSAI